MQKIEEEAYLTGKLIRVVITALLLIRRNVVSDFHYLCFRTDQ